jgi:hypothetical protein
MLLRRPLRSVIVVGMATDEEFLDDMERAARKLRAAVGSALIAGMSEADVDRIVAEGMDEVAGMHVVTVNRERADRLDAYPVGALDSTPVVNTASPIIGGHEFVVPTLHMPRHAAA